MKPAVRQITLLGQSSPTDPVISGLVFKFDFSDISALWQDTDEATPVTTKGNLLAAVGDKSDSNKDLFQSSYYLRPAYDSNVQNGRGAAACSAGGILMATASLSHNIGTGNFYFVAVDRYSGASDFGAIWSNGTYSPAIYHRPNGKIIGYWSGLGYITFSGTYSIGNHVIEFYRESGILKLAVDGVLDAATVDATGVNMPNDVQRLANDDGGFTLEGYVFEMRLYNALPSGIERKALRDFLNYKWNPSVEASVPSNQALRDAYVAQDFGALVCWNMPTFTGTEQSNPDLNVDTFAPTDLDVDNWLDACVAAGMTYAILVTKHHDGFALWNTAYHVEGFSPYSIAQTTWYANNGQPDVVSLFVTKCRAKGLTPGLYFSMQDTTYETRASTIPYPSSEYIVMIEAQLTELLTNYGDISVLWFDRWGSNLGYSAIPFETIENFVRALQPNCLILDNTGTHPQVTSEIEVYEAPATAVPSWNIKPAELVQTIRIDGHWFYNEADDQTGAAFKSAATVLAKQAETNGRNGAYLVGIMPGKDGHLPAALVTRLGEIGA